MQTRLPHFTVRALINFLVRQGLDRQQLLLLVNTSLEELNDQGTSYASAAYERLLQFGEQQLGMCNVGFLHGKAFELSFWGILGHIVAASPTIADALYYQKRYQCLLGTNGTAYHELEGDVATIRWLSGPDASANSIEQVITAWIAFAFIFTQSEDQPLSVHFTHAPLADKADYETFFRCPVFFHAEFNGVRLKTRLLQLPLNAYNQEVLDVLCHHAEQKLTALKTSGSIDIIQQFITESLPTRVPELNDVASFLGISSRQLQRNFQKQSTSLTEVLDTVRKRLAAAYLTQTDHKLVDIATILGYSEQSAFQRAFKRWFDTTPQDFRLHPRPINT
ncbi:AraC family transcriptional regulator ligand-binding domain-containing protein [Thalassotalea euphylliae]|uniref:AraC family transcriptional regulator n=1 Tax=Thalassotalea euphylliae TaxID=1655234 RepID=UPI00363D64E1